jgi:hypothetical protein
MGGYVGVPALMKLRYSDNVGIIFLWNQNLYLLQSLNISRPGEDIATIAAKIGCKLICCA